MSYNASNPVVVGGATRKSDYDRLFDNVVALKAGGLRYVLGGNRGLVVTATASGTIIPDGAIVRLADCAAIQGLILEVHFMGKVTGGTGSARLFNVTDAAYLGGAATTFTNTSDALIVISGLTIPATGSKDFRLDVWSAAAADAARVWAAQLVLR